MQLSLKDKQKNYLHESLKNLEKDLYSANNFVNKTNDIGVSLLSLLKHIEVIKKDVKDYPFLNEEFELGLKDRKILALFNQVSDSLNDLTEDIKVFNDEMQKAKYFLESHRRYRNYYFENINQSNEFLQKSSEAFNFEFIKFTPEFVGTISLADFAKELNVPRKTDCLYFTSDLIPLFFTTLTKKKTDRPFKLLAETNFGSIKFFFRNTKDILVEGEPEKLKKLDGICKNLNGSFAYN